ncbi:hypothetical protein U1Q18_017086 [Sarracenia purpurea var. burkii]
MVMIYCANRLSSPLPSTASHRRHLGPLLIAVSLDHLSLLALYRLSLIALDRHRHPGLPSSSCSCCHHGGVDLHAQCVQICILTAITIAS